MKSRLPKMAQLEALNAIVKYGSINAAARANGLSYSKFMYGLKLSGINLNRKVLADIAVNDAATFKALAETASKAVAK